MCLRGSIGIWQVRYYLFAIGKTVYCTYGVLLTGYSRCKAIFNTLHTCH